MKAVPAQTHSNRMDYTRTVVQNSQSVQSASKQSRDIKLSLFVLPQEWCKTTEQEIYSLYWMICPIIHIIQVRPTANKFMLTVYPLSPQILKLIKRLQTPEETIVQFLGISPLLYKNTNLSANTEKLEEVRPHSRNLTLNRRGKHPEESFQEIRNLF